MRLHPDNDTIKKPKILYVAGSFDKAKDEKAALLKDWQDFSKGFSTEQYRLCLYGNSGQETLYKSLNAKNLQDSIVPLYKYVKSLRPDLIVAAETKINFMVLAHKPFWPKTMRILIHENMPPNYYTRRPFPHGWMARQAYRSLYKHADALVAPCDTILQQLQLEGVCLGKAHTLYEHIHVPMTKGVGFSGLLPQKKVNFIAVGDLAEHKGYDLLLQAVSHTAMPQDWHLTLIGQGPLGDTLNHLVQGQGLESHVQLISEVEDVVPYLGAADAFLLPSLSEGMPHKALEALACGTPVIAMTSAGGIHDVAAMSEHVKTASTFEEFIDFMKDVQPQQKKTYRASLLPKTFSREHFKDTFLQIVRAILTSS